MREEKSNYHIEIEIGNAKFLITMSKLFSPRAGDNAQVVHSHAGFEVHVMSDGDAVIESENGSLSLKKEKRLFFRPASFTSASPPQTASKQAFPLCFAKAIPKARATCIPI